MIDATSPVRSHPSGVKDSAVRSSSWYPAAAQGAATWTSPLVVPSHARASVVPGSAMRSSTPGTGSPWVAMRSAAASSPSPARSDRTRATVATGLISVIPHAWRMATPKRLR